MGGSANGAQEGDAVMKLIRVECYCDRKQGTCRYRTCEPNATTKKKKNRAKKRRNGEDIFFACTCGGGCEDAQCDMRMVVMI